MPATGWAFHFLGGNVFISYPGLTGRIVPFPKAPQSPHVPHRLV